MAERYSVGSIGSFAVDETVSAAAAAADDVFTTATPATGVVESFCGAPEAVASAQPDETIRRRMKRTTMAGETAIVRPTGEKRPLPFLISAIILVFYTYCDACITLWMQVYKNSQVERTSSGCDPLLEFCPKGKDARHCGTLTSKAEPEPVVATIVDRRLEGGVTTDDAGILLDCSSKSKTCKHVRDCSWFVVRDESATIWEKKPKTFTKGTALSVQAFTGLMLSYSASYVTGGWDRLQQCWDRRRLLKFSIPGALFGFSAVCGFLAQDALSPGSYALYSQAGIIVVAVMWRLIFQKPLPLTTWVHIFMIALGIIMYRISEIDISQVDSKDDGVGLMWVGFKIAATGLASVIAEMFLKSEPDMPLCVQTSFIFPWKALMCLGTIWLLPPHGLPDRPGGFFHDWSFLTVIIVAHNLGDTVMSATLAKLFDSVVKAVCSVVGIIIPTWVFSYWMGWEDIDFGSSEGQLKASGGIVVVVSSLAYVLGRKQQADLDAVTKNMERIKEGFLAGESMLETGSQPQSELATRKASS